MTYFNIQPYDLGPVYGPIDGNNLPILGMPYCFDAFSSTPDESAPESSHKMIILEDGPRHLLETVLIEGDFETRGYIQEPPLPALWDGDDCRVISRLVYGHGKPDIPYTHVELKDGDFTQFHCKSSRFEWFDQTHFGMTQFCVMYWLKAMAMYPEYLTIGRRDLMCDEMYQKAFSLVENLKNLKAQKPFLNGDTFFIRGMNFQSGLTDVGKDVDGNDVCKLTFLGMGLAFEVWRSDGEESKFDEQFTMKYSHLFGNLLYDLLPVFTRYNLLMNMYCGLCQIKEAGLKPSKKFVEQFD